MTNYNELLMVLKPLIEQNNHEITILSNASALLNDYLEDINWVGFYLLNNNELILGPFQGHPACTNIPLNKGVCGKCATDKKTILVKNVHEFPTHIACDRASNSEICVPIFKNKKFYGLLDIDSPSLNRFDEIDQANLEEIVKIIEDVLNNTK
ncbi:MAG: GAF domain-containing protein [Acholeplasmatales bacterium]|nr:GAF domain-containing protein [Acholeplasmatales bacterium]